MRWFESWFKVWDRANNKVLWIKWATDALAVVAVRVTPTGRGSGIETTNDFGHLIEFRGGRVAGTTLYRTPEDALETAGDVRCGRVYVAGAELSDAAARRPTHRSALDEVVQFYRNGIGLTEIGGFRDHDGYEGVFLAVPGTAAHLELTSNGEHGAPAPHPESLLVLYLGDEGSVGTIAARLGGDPIPPANPVLG